MIRRRTVLAAAATTLLAACTTSAPGAAPPGAAGPGATGPGATGPGTTTEATGDAPVGVPAVRGRGSIAGTLPAAATPTARPVQAPGSAGQALPTNQWWSSALTGPRTQPLWAHPLTVQAAADGLRIGGGGPVTAAPNAITTAFRPALTVPGATGPVSVAGYGAFHVVLRVGLAGGGSVEATIVQGSPVLWLRFRDATPALSGAFRSVGGRARLSTGGQQWDVLGSGLRVGDGLTAAGSGLAVALLPDGVDPAAWERATAGADGDPVTGTEAAMAYDPKSGTVTQTLTTHRARPGVWAVLPHQHVEQPMAGSYPDARGPLAVTTGTAVRVTVPMPGLLTGVPEVSIPDADRRAVADELTRDLADPPGAGGSYFGLKELGRLASIAETAAAVGATAQQRQALDRLRPQLVDWLTYAGPADARYFGYDRVWGGLIAVPAEFGAQDYNDHHFQYGYLVRAAAVLGAADPAFARDYGDVVDAVVHDFAGGAPGFPPFRVFNAYLGSSAASGFAPFADGNNQESSSEAVAAWEAVVRWGTIRKNKTMVAYGVTHYAMEAATARMYWLGTGSSRPPGYGHSAAGIVWDAKADFATWFDAKPESILGIQLLPLTFGSLYRAGSEPRIRSLTGTPRAWGDLFAADLAPTDPAGARRLLDTPGLPREDSTSRGLVRYFVAAMGVLGPPTGRPAPIGSLDFARGGRVSAG
ncbi:glycosyl hydrolase [Actinoplanes sp. CA-030573]|uniref:glycosyl hydrolase n=1 Tax=Actinoplanes sp. CA-030573 TaxID=3239898 RepID=UPI003D89E59B